MDIVKILGFALVAVIIVSVIKSVRPEFSTYIVIVTGVVFFAYICGSVTKIFDYVRELCNYVGVEIIYIEVMFKVIGVSYMCEFVSAVCRDAGESSIAVKVDIAGKLIILSASLPIFRELINVISGIIA